MSYHRLTTLLLIVLCALAVYAQSGRRQTKNTPAAPIPTPTPEQLSSLKKDEKEPELMFLVAADHDSSSSYSSLPLLFYDTAVRGCADQLRSKSSATVDASQRDMSRGEAIKKAKSETRTYVVLLSLSFDSMGRMNRTYEDLELQFVVFAPATAKVVISGTSYLNGNRAGPLVVGRPGRAPGGVFREQALRDAGEDAANRILKALHLNIPIQR